MRFLIIALILAYSGAAFCQGTGFSIPIVKRNYLQDVQIAATHSKIEYNGKLGSYEVSEKERTYFGFSGVKDTIANKEFIKLGLTMNGERAMANASMVFRIDQGSDLLTLKANSSSSPINTLILSIPVDTAARFFGGGEQFSHVELTGHRVPFIVEENGIGRSKDAASRMAKMVGANGHKWSTYSPIPIIVSTLGQAFLIENDCFTEIDLSEPGRIGFKVHSDSLTLRVWHAESPKSLISQFTSYLGRAPELPEWAHGTWLGLQGGKRKVNEILAETQGFGNPVSAIWIQDWVGKYETKIGRRLRWEWKPNEAFYPDFKNYCDSLNEAGIQVLGYINPFLLEGTEMCDQALSEGLVVHDQQNEPYKVPFGGFQGYIIDLTNNATRVWIKDIIKKNMINEGLSGWMADFAEWLPFDAKLAGGQNPRDYHNRFAAEWAKVNREAIREAGKEGEVVFFSRSGWTGSASQTPVFWAGDQLVDFSEHDGLPSAINALISSGISGIGLNHSDVGGYTGLKFPFFKNYLRNKETLFRWIEFEAFTPFFRTHEGLLPDDMVQFYSDSSTQEFFARFGKIHQQLRPYLEDVMTQAAATGIPAIRHPWIEYPFDPKCLETEYQFFVGQDMIVAPVTKPGHTHTTAYLPAGDWIHFFTGDSFSGRFSSLVEAPIGTPAVWVRKGSELHSIISR